MQKKEYLTEENYERGKKKISKIALIILITGFLIGGSLIAVGVINQSKVNSEYSEENKAQVAEKLEADKKELTQDLEEEKQNLINSKTTIENKIKPVEDQIKSLEREPFKGFDDAYYARQDKIDELEKSIDADKKSINVINDALNEGFNYCAFDEAQNNTYTSKYCSIKQDISEKTAEIEGLDRKYSEFNKSFDSSKYAVFYVMGGFVLFVSCMIAGSIYMITKRREIAAFTMQQTMPLAQEGMEKMAPTIGNAAGTIGKELAKGIKEGINEADKK